MAILIKSGAGTNWPMELRVAGKGVLHDHLIVGDGFVDTIGTSITKLTQVLERGLRVDLNRHVVKGSNVERSDGVVNDRIAADEMCVGAPEASGRQAG